jgi:2-iminobutanoate/2-iminopropanoate deaminase
MSSNSSRVVSTRDAPKPLGPYSQGVAIGGFIFCSGQIGLDPVTGLIASGGAAREAERALLNLKAVLEAAGTGLNEVVKVTLFLRDLKDFSDVNEVYARYFGESLPARTTLEVSALPRGALVEVDAIARVP